VCCSSVGLTLLELGSTRTFYSSRPDNYNDTQGPIGGLEVGKILCSKALMARVANDVFNDVDMPDLIAYHAALSQQYDIVLYSRLAL
jgi:hypothetical protein